MLLFERYQPFYAHFVMRMRASGGCTVVKPKPLQQSEVQRCAEMAQSGSIDMLYARVVAYIKWLNGCRNPVFAAWKWKDIKFIPTIVFEQDRPDGVVCAPLSFLPTYFFTARGNRTILHSFMQRVAIVLSCSHSCLHTSSQSYYPACRANQGRWLQLAFAFVCPIPWDKAPNRHGQKVVAVDPSFSVWPGDEGNCCSNPRVAAHIASVGSHLLMLAVHQGLISLSDLDGLKVGETFTVKTLLQRRASITGDTDLAAFATATDDMYGTSLR